VKSPQPQPAPRPASPPKARRSRLRRLALAAAVLALSALPASAAVVQQGNLRITLISQVQPYKLPRTGTAPIAILVSGHVAPVTGEVPDQLEGLQVRVNRHALLQSRGLPACTIAQIQPATTERALANCGEALIGSGQFWAHIVLPDQGAYPTQGRLLVFNGRRHGRPIVLAHIFTAHPFATSFVIPFSIRHIDSGYYGTQLSASLPEALGSWGYVDRIKLTLKRKYRFHGRELSYFNAGCPAVAGASRASFHLAYATFSFANRNIGAQVDKSCGVAE
jgi:hypothetical protein